MTEPKIEYQVEYKRGTKWIPAGQPGEDREEAIRAARALAGLTPSGTKVRVRERQVTVIEQTILYL